MTLGIVPVFCTANIPAATLDLFITDSEEYAEKYSFVPRIIDSTDASAIRDVEGPSEAPIPEFTTPFEGMTIAELNEIFVSQFKPLEQFTYSLFIVLDERSIEDETCLVVSGGNDFEEDNEMDTLRSDFYIPMAFVCQAELGVTDLGENLDRSEVWGLHNISRDTI